MKIRWPLCGRSRGSDSAAEAAENFSVRSPRFQRKPRECGGGSLMALTVKRVTRLKKPGRYGDGHGLYLQVVNKDNRSWLLRYERGGRERYMGLGPLHTVSLEEAREKAREQRKLLLEGPDPIDANRAPKSAQLAATATK